MRGSMLLLPAMVLAASLAAVTGAAVAETAIVHVDVDRADPSVGDIVTVTVKVRRAVRVASAPFTLQFDPEILAYVPTGAREGDFLSGGDAPTVFLAREARTRTGGTGVMVGLARMGARLGARGRGVLCVLKFKAVSPGTTSLAFTRARLMDPGARPVEAVFRGATLTVKGVP